MPERWRDPKTGRFGYQEPNALLRGVLDARDRAARGEPTPHELVNAVAMSPVQRAQQVRERLNRVNTAAAQVAQSYSLDELLRRVVAAGNPEEGTE